MDVGVIILPSDLGIRFDRLAVEAEARGIDAIAVADHMHEPIVTAAGDHDPPSYFKRCLDPWVVLSSAAAVTSRIKLGTCVYLMAQRHPLVTAKAVASLDHVSGGRVELGVGWGWNRAEAEDYGVQWKFRREQVREHVAAARALWEDDEASFAGEFVRFGPCLQYPKPVQARMPVLVGCMAGPRNFTEIADWADGWLPMREQVEDPAASIAFLQRVAADRGRDPTELSVRVCGLDRTLEGARQWRDLGATHASALFRGDVSTDDALRNLDVLAAAAEKLR